MAQVGNHSVFDNTYEIILELQFGEGGYDSKLFVEELLGVYVRYATNLKFKTEILADEDGHAILKIAGNGVWKAFSHEGGKHCVQRYPKNDSGGRRHTSMISVAIMPLPPTDAEDVLDEKELEITTQCGKQHAGGQHANKTASAVRIKHKPTGLSVFINGRDQHANRREALKIITARVSAQRQQKKWEEYNSYRKQQINGGRGGKLRTYNFIESRIVDHKLNLKTHNVKEFMKGDFSVLFDSVEKE